MIWQSVLTNSPDVGACDSMAAVQIAGQGSDARAWERDYADHEPSHCSGRRAIVAQMSKIPWSETAVLVLLDNPDARQIVAEGTLRQIANRIAVRPPADWHRFLISLPDRGAAPFAYRAPEFETLIDALAS